MFLAFLLFFRIKDPVGEVMNIERIENKTSFDEFINKFRRAVVIYFPEEKGWQMDFADYSIVKFKRVIAFAAATPKFAHERNITDLPNFEGFENGTKVEVPSFYPDAMGFSNWCYYFLGRRAIKIMCSEELRQLFESHKSVLICVDEAEHPSDFPKDQLIYEASSEVFNYFNITVEKGIYVYRAADRQLLKATQYNYKSLMKSYCVDLYDTDPYSKKYVAGYFLDLDNNSLIDEEVQILNKLGEKFQKNFHFAPLTGRPGMIYYKTGGFSHFTPPLFVVVESNNPSKRWAINDFKKMHDVKYITKFIKKIESGKEPYTIISEEIESTDPMKIVTKEYFGKIKDDNSDSVVAFIKESIPNYIQVRETIKKCQEILRDNGVKFYFFDVSKNDYPQKVSQIERIPFLLEYKKGTAEKPSYYRGSYDVDPIINWVSKYSSTQFSIPSYDPQRVKTEIEEAVSKSENINIDEL